MHFKFFFTFFLVFQLGFVAFGQQFNEKQVQLIDGNTYYLHKVEQGNTLYSISKMYSVPIKDLLKENPTLETGLKVDQVIRIPVKKVSPKVSGGNAPKTVGEFMFHTVEAKETLYGLAKKYRVEVAEIEAINPELSDGLKIGMELKIPMPPLEKVENQFVIQPAKEDSFLLHLVEPKETFYSLAKEYDVNIDSLRLLNEGLADGLKVGTTIRIPIVKEAKEPVALEELKLDFVNRDSILKSVKKERYKICLMLPLYLAENDSISEKKLAFEKDELFVSSRIGMSFYAGFKTAIDSLDRAGYKFDVVVYDTKFDPITKSTAKVEALLLRPEIQDVDLFIGPFHRANFEVVAKFANDIKKPIISPVPQNINLLSLSPYVIKTNSSPESQVAIIREYVLANYADKNLILMENNHLKDILLSEKFSGIVRGDTNKAVYKKVNSKFNRLVINAFDTAHFAYMLKDSVENIIVVPLENNTFVARLLNVLNKTSRKYEITVFGMDKWETFSYLDFRYLNNLKVHLPLNYYIDYDSATVQDMFLKYKTKYYTEPDEWGVLGYDIGLYFLNQLNKAGTAFFTTWNGETYQGLGTRFQFEKMGPGKGYENRGTQMIKMENYFQKRVN
ncbi:MAG: LysM peptidoglycan-binding domain-containing protein [Flavobacteriales bacterium]|nr:LysM peptidoglycan-binding domain-containing protein [Flavobacteriales bacterium]